GRGGARWPAPRDRGERGLPGAPVKIRPPAWGHGLSIPAPTDLGTQVFGTLTGSSLPRSQEYPEFDDGLPRLARSSIQTTGSISTKKRGHELKELKRLSFE